MIIADKYDEIFGREKKGKVNFDRRYKFVDVTVLLVIK